MKTVAILAIDGVVPFDLATPCEVFGRVQVAGIGHPYQVRVCAERATVRAEAFDLRVPGHLAEVVMADTVILPGMADVEQPVPPAIIAAIQAAAARGSRIASICTGAFLLAAAGLLDGLRATTHWLAAPALAARYPAVQVDPGVLFVDNGQILTSAGAAAGLDLCLHMIRRDWGATVAADAARMSVVPLERDGGQAQFILHELPASAGSLAPLLDWAWANLDRPLDLGALARQAGMSPRTLTRKFRQQTGTTPLQWVLSARVRRAQELLEATDLSVEAVVSATGFDTAASLREHFRRTLETTPMAYRRAFRGQQATQGCPSPSVF